MPSDPMFWISRPPYQSLTEWCTQPRYLTGSDLAVCGQPQESLPTPPSTWR